MIKVLKTPEDRDPDRIAFMYGYRRMRPETLDDREPFKPRLFSVDFNITKAEADIRKARSRESFAALGEHIKHVFKDIIIPSVSKGPDEHKHS